MANKEREEKIKYWMDMGLEKLAQLHWTLWKQNKELREARYSSFKRAMAENMGFTAARTIMQENEILKDILSENGIRTRKLIVKYETRACDKCPDYDAVSGCCTSDSWEDVCEYKTVTERIGFYSFKIDDGALQGFTSDFRAMEYDTIEVIDEKTGKVLYKYEKSEDDKE